MRIYRVLTLILILTFLSACTPENKTTPTPEVPTLRINLAEVYDLKSAAFFEVLQLNQDVSEEIFSSLLEIQNADTLSRLAELLGQPADLQPDTFCMPDYKLKIHFLDGKQTEFELLNCSGGQMALRLEDESFEGWQVQVSEKFESFFFNLLAENAAEPDQTAQEDSKNLATDYDLAVSSRVVLSELHLPSGEAEEQSSYQPVSVLEDSEEINRLINSLDMSLELQAAARCPAKGRLSFYAAENLLYELGLGCDLEEPFFLVDLQSGQHYVPPAAFLEILQKLLAQAAGV